MHAAGAERGPHLSFECAIILAENTFMLRVFVCVRVCECACACA